MVKGGHFWQRFTVIGIVLMLVLAACTPETEPVPTPVPPKPTATATELPTETAAPSATATVESVTEETVATATPEPPPTSAPEPAFVDLGPLPVSEELGLSIVDQWGGVAQSLDLVGTTAYTGFGPRLLIVDVSDSAAPQLLGQSDILPDLVRDVDVADGLAYLSAGMAGLMILDVSDPAAITIVNGGPNYAVDQPAKAESVTVNNGSAFVVEYNRFDGQTTLLRFDVTDPEQVVLLGEYALPPNASAQIYEELIVVINRNQMQLRDAARPDAIMSQTPLAAGDYTSRVVLQDDVVTVAQCCALSGIERFDVSDPFHPAALGPLQEVEMMPPSHAAAEGQLLVTAGTFGEFGYCGSTVNFTEIGDEGSEMLASLDPKNCLSSLVLDGEKLYLSGRSGLQIYDVSDPSDPVLLGQFRHPDGFHDAQGLARRDGLTYALNAEGRNSELTTLELSQQAADLVLDQQIIGQEALLDLFTTGDTLIVPIWMGSLYTLDISDPAAPQPLHQPTDGELYSGDLFTVVIKGDVLYLPVVDNTLVGAVGAIDLSDPADPLLAGTVETGDWQVMNLALSGDTLYVLSQGEQSHVTLYDVSKPLTPEQLAVLTMPEFVSRLAVVGDTLYAACDFYNCQAVYAVDISDKQNPDLSSRWTIPFGVRDMIVDGQGTIYLVTSAQQIWSMDGADPTQLRLTGAVSLPGEFTRLKVEEDQIYAASFDGGLYQIEVRR